MPRVLTGVSWGPEFSSKVIRWLTGITCALSIFSALFDSLFSYFFGFRGLQELLSLSWGGLSHFFIWQPLTYLFVQQPAGGIHFFFLISLFFHMYLLWILGHAIVEYIGTTPFLRLYLLSGIFAGLSGIVVMTLTGAYTVLSGCTPSILAILVLWTMFYPEVELLFFFILPIKAKWLTSGLLGAILLIDLSQWDLVGLTTMLTGAAIGYGYALLAWDLSTPFPIAHSSDLFIKKIGQYLRHKSPKKPLFKSSQKAKIVDFKSGKGVEQDEAFVDAMLEKISKHGENSLSWRERRKLQKISEKKKGKFS